jgi:dienelactone hydrolase
VPDEKREKIMRQNPRGIIIALFAVLVIFTTVASGQEKMTREHYLQQLRNVLPPDFTIPNWDQLPGTPPARISPDDFTWGDWLERTGELPPDFDKLPSLPFLPDPLILDEGGKNIPVTTIEQWYRKREEIMEQTQYWITGTVPPPPGNVIAQVLEEKKSGNLRELTILLRFGPDHQAQLHVNLLIPPGDGPFPVFMCPWKKDDDSWVQAAVRRGYIGCRFTGTDPKYGYPDDSEKYEDIWWPEYDFSTMMRWGWAASRAIDYLYTLDYVNRDHIALTGLSRNGKMALWAAAYDERIKAVVPISGCTGGENPYRYSSDKYNSETLEVLSRLRPHWMHPRLRFFVGRESKLPADQNSLMALVAPRGLMLSASITESAGNPWGIEQAFLSARTAYEFLGAEDKIAIDHRQGLHAPSARDMERYLDFFDYMFGRGNTKPGNELFYNYTFSRWIGLSGEMIDPVLYEVKGNDDLLIDARGRAIRNSSSWMEKVPGIRQNLIWALGEEPPSLAPGRQTDYMRDVVGSPRFSPEIKSMPLMFGQLYYKETGTNGPGAGKMPVVIYLHEYSYSKGYAKKGSLINGFLDAGYAVLVFDQIGFGTRIEEGRLFYERFPNWSKMGRMVADVRWSVDALAEVEFIDAQRIYAAGYALGGTVGLYSAALDERIAGVIAVSGFTPMRSNSPGKTPEGIYEYSHLHGLLPRLGFFVKNETRIPYDFHEILASIAPRPLLIVAPSWDQYASLSDIRHCMNQVEKVYDLFKGRDKVELYVPEDYNRLSDEMVRQMILWMQKNLN